MKRILSLALVMLMTATAPSLALEVTIQDEDFSYTTIVPDGAEETSFGKKDSKFYDYEYGKGDEHSDLQAWLSIFHANSCEEARSLLYGSIELMLKEYGSNECVMTYEEGEDVEIVYLIFQDGPVAAKLELSFEKKYLRRYNSIIDSIVTSFKDGAGYSIGEE
jgi:hypothetical protein